MAEKQSWADAMDSDSEDDYGCHDDCSLCEEEHESARNIDNLSITVSENGFDSEVDIDSEDILEHYSCTLTFQGINETDENKARIQELFEAGIPFTLLSLKFFTSTRKEEKGMMYGFAVFINEDVAMQRFDSTDGLPFGDQVLHVDVADDKVDSFVTPSLFVRFIPVTRPGQEAKIVPEMTKALNTFVANKFKPPGSGYGISDYLKLSEELVSHSISVQTQTRNHQSVPTIVLVLTFASEYAAWKFNLLLQRFSLTKLSPLPGLNTLPPFQIISKYYQPKERVETTMTETKKEEKPFFKPNLYQILAKEKARKQ
jgi:hypothetical protein